MAERDSDDSYTLRLPRSGTPLGDDQISEIVQKEANFWSGLLVSCGLGEKMTRKELEAGITERLREMYPYPKDPLFPTSQ